MKKIWKALGIAALATVVPVRFKKDHETGKKTFQSLLWKLDITPKDGDKKEIGLDLMEGVITAPLMNAIAVKKEKNLFTDDPEEAVLFADDDPAAAVVDADPMETAAEQAEAAAEAVESTVEQAEAIAEAAEAAAEQAESIAEAVAEPEVTEEDFDPDL